jgi:thioredoxin-like negative regulator of GroEL
MKFSRDSEIKARFALAVLRVAQGADRKTAARLLHGLARDLPHSDERREVIALHFDAIQEFEKLTETLRVSLAAPNAWRSATEAISKWLSAVDRS